MEQSSPAPVAFRRPSRGSPPVADAAVQNCMTLACCCCVCADHRLRRIPLPASANPTPAARIDPGLTWIRVGARLAAASASSGQGRRCQSDGDELGWRPTVVASRPRGESADAIPMRTVRIKVVPRVTRATSGQLSGTGRIVWLITKPGTPSNTSPSGPSTGWPARSWAVNPTAATTSSSALAPGRDGRRARRSPPGANGHGTPLTSPRMS